MSKPLEPRIAAALNGGDLASDAVAALIAEVEAATGAADAEAAAVREQALNPAITIDVAKVASAVAAAELTAGRMKAALPKLRARYADVEMREQAARWNAAAEPLKARREERLTEFAALLPPELLGKIVAQLHALHALDREISAHNGRLRQMELHAIDRRMHVDGCRFLPKASPAWTAELKVPDPEKPSGHYLWPPPPNYSAAMIRPDPFVGQFAADGTYQREQDERRREAIRREREEAERRERAFAATGVGAVNG
jgi:hypothetical protein